MEKHLQIKTDQLADEVALNAEQYKIFIHFRTEDEKLLSQIAKAEKVLA